MVNLFDFEKDDATFVEATKDSHQCEMKIARLCIARSWLLVGLLLQSLFLLAILLLDWRQFLSNSALQLFVYACNMAAIYHTDLQIKFLKASK